VNHYTITITPDTSGAAVTTVRVLLDGERARITDLAVRAGEGQGLSARALPSVDLDMLLRAVLPATAPGNSATRVELAPSRRRGRTRAGAASPSRGQNRRAATTPAEAAPTRSASRRASDPESGRAYRRMPDDLADVFARLGSVTRVAEHYAVPRHTAQGWVGRLRSSGVLPAGQPRTGRSRTRS
jgi:hypothetical protein